MKYVAIKSEWQQELMQLHRVREWLIKTRTALGNELRGFLYELGIVVVKGIEKLSQRVREALLYIMGTQLIQRLI